MNEPEDQHLRPALGHFGTTRWWHLLRADVPTLSLVPYLPPDQRSSPWGAYKHDLPPQMVMKEVGAAQVGAKVNPSLAGLEPQLHRR